MNRTPANQEDWRAFWEIYEKAADMPPAERLALVESCVESCRCAPEVARELLELLEVLDAEPSAPISPAPRRGKSGRYVVMQELGRGGMGQVFAAQDTELDRMVALKVLSPAVLAESSVETLVREAKAASALNHPNIVTVHEVIEWEAGLAIVMEMVEGKALRSLVGISLLNEELAHLGAQIAAALAEAHARGIIHRDIKPENILVREDGYVKLLDLGLARRVDAGQSSSGNLAAGTLRYISPEQTRGHSLTVASDIFSLGVVLYELAAGVHPFEAPSPFEVVHSAATREPRPPSRLNPSLHPGLSKLILAMLSKQPENRPSAQAVATALQTFSFPKLPGNRYRKFASWFRAPIAWWAIAALLGTAAVFILLWRLAPEKLLIFQQVANAANENRVTTAAIAADGNSLLFADAEGIIHLRDMKAGDTATLARIPDSYLSRIAWFPDGSRALVSGFLKATRQSIVWVLTREQNKVEVLRGNAFQAVPSPDGKEIAF